MAFSWHTSWQLSFYHHGTQIVYLYSQASADKKVSTIVQLRLCMLIQLYLLRLLPSTSRISLEIWHYLQYYTSANQEHLVNLRLYLWWIQFYQTIWIYMVFNLRLVQMDEMTLDSRTLIYLDLYNIHHSTLPYHLPPHHLDRYFLHPSRPSPEW